MAVDGPRVIGRYTLFDTIGTGGMATVHLGRASGSAVVLAIKRLFPSFAADKRFVAMFIDEARIAARVRHPNVVRTLEVVCADAELLLVMEYVPGESLAQVAQWITERRVAMPLSVFVAISCGLLRGLHAAHEARSESGEPLGIVHRDVSPHNVVVGVDGVPRVLDFGVAKAAGRIQTTRDGHVKGKLAYMAPEQLMGDAITRRADVYSASVVAWELLTGARLFTADSEGAMIQKVLAGAIPPPSKRARVAPPLDAVVMRGLAHDPAERFASAEEMAAALEACAPPAPPEVVASWFAGLAGDRLAERARTVAALAARRSGGRRVWPLAALGASILGASTVAALVAWGRVGSSAPSPEVLAPSSTTSAAPPPSSASAVLEPVVPDAGPAPAVCVTRPLAPAPAPTPRREVPRRAGCDPPWVLDRAGNKTYKRECF